MKPPVVLLVDGPHGPGSRLALPCVESRPDAALSRLTHEAAGHPG